ncbi:RraA family protein [Benzoatithermus flavus]|uniref:Regulator of RNase E activity RraA n=1 Tax=Benzoatithermus flavus TaxID=3108223 RepID=A0ABU8XW27_9PROT
MTIDPKLLDHLRAFDTPTICNALEIVAPERRVTGFTTKPFVCAFPSMPPILGFARTATIRARERPDLPAAELKARRLAYYEYVAGGAGPAIVVVQDLDPEPGFGSFWGEVNTAIHKGLGVAGCITNGSIRDLDMIATDFQLLAGSVGPSHAWVHVESFAQEVTVHGMTVRHGDLLHADKHGAVTIPADAVERLPHAIDLVTRREAPIIAAARQPGFSIEKLRVAMAEADEIH